MKWVLQLSLDVLFLKKKKVTEAKIQLGRMFLRTSG